MEPMRNLFACAMGGILNAGTTPIEMLKPLQVGPTNQFARRRMRTSQ